MTGHNVKTVYGGLLSLSIFTIISILIYTATLRIASRKGTKYVSSHFHLSDKEIDKIKLNLTEHNETINFAFGIYLPDHLQGTFDIFNNKYFEVIAYQLKDKQSLTQLPDYSLR